MKKSLVIWTGMPSENLSGGDSYLVKFIKFSNLNPDIILPEQSKKFISQYVSETYEVSPSNSEDLFSLIKIYAKRLIQSLYILLTNKKHYELAIASSPFLFDILPLALSRSKKKVVILYHVIPKRKPKNLKTLLRFAIAGIEKKISFFLIKKYITTIITGNKVEKQKLDSIFPNKKIIIADAGFDTKIIDKYPKQKKDKNLACFAGRLTSQKGIFDLVEIMSFLKSTHPKLKLVMLGDGPDRKELELRIKKANLSSIELKGFVSEAEKYKYLNKAAYFFFPSYEEGWGIALAEALYTKNICFCYELPHYKSIFSTYPIYAKKGSTKDFIAGFSRHKKPNLNKQKSFMKKYDDKIVIRKVIDRLTKDLKGNTHF